jgi:hypothetical protein
VSEEEVIRLSPGYSLNVVTGIRTQAWGHNRPIKQLLLAKIHACKGLRLQVSSSSHQEGLCLKRYLHNFWSPNPATSYQHNKINQVVWLKEEELPLPVVVPRIGAADRALLVPFYPPKKISFQGSFTRCSRQLTVSVYRMQFHGCLMDDLSRY